MGFEVTIAEDGNQAVEKALAEAFDLILLDMQMPNMNGYEAESASKERLNNTHNRSDRQCYEGGRQEMLRRNAIL